MCIYLIALEDGELLLSRSREGFTKMFFGNDDILFSDDPVSLKSLNSCMPGSELLVYASYPVHSLVPSIFEVTLQEEERSWLF